MNEDCLIVIMEYYHNLKWVKVMNELKMYMDDRFWKNLSEGWW